MELISIAAAAIGAVLGAGVVLLLKRTPRKPAAAPQPDDFNIAYYRRNLLTGAEDFSRLLRSMFSMDDFTISWDGFAKLLPDVHRDELNKALVAARERPEPTLLTMSLDEGKRQVECIIAARRNAEQLPVQVVVIFRDVTALLRQQSRIAKENEQLKREVRQYSNILNVLTLPVWLRGNDLAIRYCNLAYSEAAEEDPERSSDQESLELYPQARALAQAALAAGSAQAQRKHIIVGGSRKLFEFTEIPLKSDGIMVGIAQDVTEFENVQEELHRHISAHSELLESVTSAMAVFGSDQRLKFLMMPSYGFGAWRNHGSTPNRVMANCWRYCAKNAACRSRPISPCSSSATLKCLRICWSVARRFSTCRTGARCACWPFRMRWAAYCSHTKT